MYEELLKLLHGLKPHTQRYIYIHFYLLDYTTYTAHEFSSKIKSVIGCKLAIRGSNVFVRHLRTGMKTLRTVPSATIFFTYQFLSTVNNFDGIGLDFYFTTYFTYNSFPKAHSFLDLTLFLTS